MTRKENVNVLEATEFVEGIVIELNKTNLNSIDVKQYFINEYKEMEYEKLGEIHAGEIYPYAKTPKKAIEIIKRNVENITRQRTAKVYVAEEVIDLFLNVLG